jgi:hypothetical protein
VTGRVKFCDDGTSATASFVAANGPNMDTMIANTLPPAQALLAVLGFAALIGLLFLVVKVVSLKMGGWKTICLRLASRAKEERVAPAVFLVRWARSSSSEVLSRRTMRR